MQNQKVTLMKLLTMQEVGTSIPTAVIVKLPELFWERSMYFNNSAEESSKSDFIFMLILILNFKFKFGKRISINLFLQRQKMEQSDNVIKVEMDRYKGVIVENMDLLANTEEEFEV